MDIFSEYTQIGQSIRIYMQIAYDNDFMIIYLLASSHPEHVSKSDLAQHNSLSHVE
jgi:hypothetical protein